MEPQDSSHFTPFVPAFKDHWFSFGHNCVAVRESVPSGTPRAHLFLLHGRFDSARSFEPVAVRFAAAEIRVLMPDLPGFGRSLSVVDRALSLIEHAELSEALIRRFVLPGDILLLGGQDFGGAIAQMLALRLGAAVDGIILLNSRLLSREIRPRVGWRGWQARKLWKSLLADSFPKASPGRSFVGEPWKDRARWKILMASFRGLQAAWPGPFERDVWARELAAIHSPILLLRGSRDPLFGEDDAAELIRGYADVSYFQASCGHWLSLERPDWVAEKLREFLFRLEGKKPSRKAA